MSEYFALLDRGIKSVAGSWQAGKISIVVDNSKFNNFQFGQTT